MGQLTELEKEIFDYISEMIGKQGYSPSVRDIQNSVGIKSTSTVHAYLRRLEEKGYIQKESGKSRTLRIDGAETHVMRQHTVKIPLVGKVAAGMPILAVENHEGYIDYPLMNRSYMPNELFALRVAGESMIEAGILDGDMIVVARGNTAQNGEIVVAMIDGEATVKTLYRENGHIRLQPENQTMKPIIAKEVIVLGKVVSVFRYY